MTIDPLLSLLVGALGAALLGLLGAAIQSRREHARWVREHRLATYERFMQVAYRVPRLDAGAGSLGELQSHQKEIKDALASLILVGPDSVIDAASVFMVEAFAQSNLPSPSQDAESFARARVGYQRAAQSVLAIKSKKR